MNPELNLIPIHWHQPPVRENLDATPFFKVVQVKEIFLWVVYYLNNQSVLDLSLTCKFVRAQMQTKELYKKAAWSLSKGIPFDPLTNLRELNTLYHRINIHFPKLIMAFGSLQSLSEIPCQTIPQPIETYGFPVFSGRALRGFDSQNKPFIAFRLKVKDPYRLQYTEQIEVIYCVDNCWKRLVSDNKPHLTLGIHTLNDPELEDIFTNRLKLLWSGRPAGVAEERPEPDPLYGRVHYQSSTVSGPYSSYVTL